MKRIILVLSVLCLEISGCHFLWTNKFKEQQISLEVNSVIKASNSRITDVAYSSDGKYIGVFDSDGFIKIFTPVGEEIITIKSMGGKQKYANDYIHNIFLEFSFDSMRIIVKENSGVRIFDLDGNLVKFIESTVDENFDISHEGFFITSFTPDKSVKIWNSLGENIVSLPIHEYGLQIVDIDVASDGQHLMLLDKKDNYLRLFRIDQKKVEEKTSQFNKYKGIESARFTSDGEKIILINSCDRIGCLKILDLMGNPLQSIDGVDISVHFDVSSSGKYISTISDGQIYNWDTSGELMNTFFRDDDDLHIFQVRFSPNERQILSVDKINSIVSLVNSFDQSVSKLEGIGFPMTFSPSGHEVIGGYYGDGDIGKVGIWNISN